MVWNPKLAMGVAVILWAPCLPKKGSFYIIGKQKSGLLCSQLYACLLYGWYCSLKPNLDFSLFPFDEKCMKALLDEDYRLGGITLPQYFPMTLAVFESPSYKVKESHLKSGLI